MKTSWTSLWASGETAERLRPVTSGKSCPQSGGEPARAALSGLGRAVLCIFFPYQT